MNSGYPLAGISPPAAYSMTIGLVSRERRLVAANDDLRWAGIVELLSNAHDRDHRARHRSRTRGSRVSTSAPG